MMTPIVKRIVDGKYIVDFDVKEGRIMGFTEVLTLLFIILKVFEIIAWSRWIVLLPEIIAVGFCVILATSAALFGAHIWKGLKQ